MESAHQSKVTQTLAQLGQLDPGKVAETLLPIVYDELHDLAEGYLRKERKENCNTYNNGRFGTYCVGRTFVRTSPNPTRTPSFSEWPFMITVSPSRINLRSDPSDNCNGLVPFQVISNMEP